MIWADRVRKLPLITSQTAIDEVFSRVKQSEIVPYVKTGNHQYPNKICHVFVFHDPVLCGKHLYRIIFFEFNLTTFLCPLVQTEPTCINWPL